MNRKELSEEMLGKVTGGANTGFVMLYWAYVEYEDKAGNKQVYEGEKTKLVKKAESDRQLKVKEIAALGYKPLKFCVKSNENERDN